MKAAAILAVALLFTGCAGSLKNHAQAAATLRDVIDTVGEAIQKEASEDVEELDALPQEVRQERLEALRRIYVPVNAAYSATRSAWGAYRDAIVEAQASGDKTLARERAQLVRVAWDELLKVAEALGIKVPTAPEILDRVLGGKS